jgi:hypothetical protein
MIVAPVLVTPEPESSAKVEADPRATVAGDWETAMEAARKTTVNIAPKHRIRRSRSVALFVVDVLIDPP